MKSSRMSFRKKPSTVKTDPYEDDPEDKELIEKFGADEVKKEHRMPSVNPKYFKEKASESDSD